MHIFIFNRGLRLVDNTTLIHQIKQSGAIVPVFIFTPEQINPKENKYFSNNINNGLVDKYFIGPPEYSNGNANYITIDEWKNIELTRNSSHVYNFNNQPFLIKTFLNNIII